jgi:putative ABC transport system permease protein
VVIRVKLSQIREKKKKKMKTIDFVIKDITVRYKKSLSGVLFIILGISVFTASQTINKALFDRAKEQLIRFGANIIVQPKGAPYDISSGTVKGGILIPESYVGKIRSIKHGKMLVAISPKLFERFDLGGRSVLFAGITREEEKAKPWWMVQGKLLGDNFPGENEILLGYYSASYLEKDIKTVKLNNETFRVKGILDETGSPDDFMVFIRLDALQKLSKEEGMVNLIEVSTSCIACKSMNINDIAGDIGKILPPGAEVKLIKQIAGAQMGTLNKIDRFTTVISISVLLLCVILLINYTTSSIEENRREIGILLAMGMDPLKIQAIFVIKIIVLALSGGIAGFVIGSGISVFLGPLIADAKITVLFYLLPVSIIIALVIAVISIIIPAKKISNLDPIEALREV